MNTPQFARMSYRVAKRIAIGVVGVTVCLIGIVMIVFPGPAIVVIPAGLAILSIEFAFARRWLKVVRQRISGMAQSHRMQNRRSD